MKDFFGRPVALGDTVAFIETNYRSFRRGEVIAVTPQKLRIRYKNGFRQDPLSETLRYPSETIKE